MKRILKWAVRGLLALVLVAVVALGALYVLLRNTVAPADGEAPVAGLSAPVTIFRDAYAIPHIEAENRLDAVRALGWLHASERLWQMEVLRMAGQGRLAEMFGDQALASDRFLRTLDIPTASRQSLDRLNDRTRAVVDAYVAGINAWIGRDTGATEPTLPVEFLILGHRPEPWQAWHSVMIPKVMALTLDANMNEEIGRLALAGRRFTPEMIGEIFPPNDRDRPPPLPDLAALYGFDTAPRSASLQPAEAAEAPWRLQLPASNNWAISGSRTESGRPLLANDPHLGFTAPSTFYLAHMRWQEEGAGRNLVGGTLPGVPLVLSGRNDRIAWGLTTTYLDSQDLFLEKINPDDPRQYLTPDGYREFERDEAILKVKGGGDVTLERLRTRHGPVLPMGYRRLGELLPPGHVAAIAWTALSPDDTTLEALLAMGDARSVGEFLARSQKSVSPMQSVVVADADGNIGLTAAGLIPERSPANPVAGRAPVPGWDAAYDWQGTVDKRENPVVVNPLRGAVATANSNWLPEGYPEGYPHHITYDWAEPQRQARVEQLFVDSSQMQSVQTMLDGQADRYSGGMVALRDTILRLLPQGVRIDEELIRGLAGWDGRMTADSPFPLIITAWHRHLGETVLRDDLGEDYGSIPPANLDRLMEILRDAGARNWCDNIATSEAEDCGDAIFAAGQAMLAELKADYGDDWHRWRWGTAHETVHEHRPFSRVGALSGFFTIRAEMDGGRYTLLRNSTDFAGKMPYAGVHGSALRTVYDFADLEKSLYMISTGQSGNVFSPHYRDLNALWARLDYVTIPTEPAAYRAAAAGTFTLTPGTAQ